MSDKQQLRDGSAPGHLLPLCLLAVLSSLSMKEVTEGELGNLGSLGVKAAPLKSACSPILCLGAYCECLYQGWEMWLIFAGASLGSPPAPTLHVVPVL